ncbi:hypothetical protein PF008_g27126, partial [Phytophthora fragariae]
VHVTFQWSRALIKTIKFSRSRSGAPSASPASPGGLGVLAGVADTPPISRP